jgi:hypothetical protein
MGREADHSRPFSADIKKALENTTTSLSSGLKTFGPEHGDSMLLRNMFSTYKSTRRYSSGDQH